MLVYQQEKFSDYQENRKKVKAELSKEILDRKNELAAFTKSWGQNYLFARQVKTSQLKLQKIKFMKFGINCLFLKKKLLEMVILERIM